MTMTDELLLIKRLSTKSRYKAGENEYDAPREQKV